MVRLAVPVLCCAALLWESLGGPACPRRARAVPAATGAVTADIEELLSEPVVRTPGTGSPTPLAGDEPPPPDPDELRQHDIRDLVARGCDVECLSRWVERETGARVSAIVNVLEVVAPAGKQIALERLLDERRRAGPGRVLQFYDVKDLCADEESTAPGPAITDEATPDVEPTSPFPIDSLIEVIEATVTGGAAEIQPKNRVLVVRAEPAIQAEIARFLGDLRSDCGPAPPQDR